MLLKDFILYSVLRWTNQRLPSWLLGTTGITNYINYALNDIYTFEGRYWTFMYDVVELDCTTSFTSADEVVYVDVPYPLLRVMYIEDLSQGTSIYNTSVERTTKLANQFDALLIKPDDKIDPNHFYFKQHTKRIYLRNNNNTYRIHYLHYFDRLEYNDTTEIPVPEIFLWALYELTMGYIYPNYWQQWENKEANAFNKGRQQLVDLAKTDSMQLSGVLWNNIK